MTDQQRLVLLKADLQLLTSANDALLSHLLQAAEAAVKREGIRDDGTADYDAVIISYAAYLFRKRAAAETGMPRFLRWMMNNLLLSQKAGGES